METQKPEPKFKPKPILKIQTYTKFKLKPIPKYRPKTKIKSIKE